MFFWYFRGQSAGQLLFKILSSEGSVQLEPENGKTSWRRKKEKKKNFNAVIKCIILTNKLHPVKILREVYFLAIAHSNSILSKYMLKCAIVLSFFIRTLAMKFVAGLNELHSPPTSKAPDILGIDLINMIMTWRTWFDCFLLIFCMTWFKGIRYLKHWSSKAVVAWTIVDLINEEEDSDHYDRIWLIICLIFRMTWFWLISQLFTFVSKFAISGKKYLRFVGLADIWNNCHGLEPWLGNINWTDRLT